MLPNAAELFGVKVLALTILAVLLDLFSFPSNLCTKSQLHNLPIQKASKNSIKYPALKWFHFLNLIYVLSFSFTHFAFFFFFPKWLNYLCCLSSTFSVHLSRVTERTPCEAAGRLWHAGPLCCACKSVPGWEGHVKIRGPGESLTPLTPYLEKAWH